MDVSVVIPTFGRPDKVRACVRRLVTQSLSIERYEVLVGVDAGLHDPDGVSRLESQLRERWPARYRDRLRVVACAKVGQAAVRNELLRSAAGDTLVFLNDDTVPSPVLLERHLIAQSAARRGGHEALVVGAAHWVTREEESLFDRLIRETSMVFFYDRMDKLLRDGEVGRDHDWGFRHAWLINLSAPAGLVREAGGFTVFPATYGYEDDEFAHRCRERFGTPVLYRPEAAVQHDHRLTPESYLERERRLGYAAWGFAGLAPDCAREMFRCDVRDPEELDYSRAFVTRERANAERLRLTFHELADVPGEEAPALAHPAGPTVIDALAQQHLLLKRWEWRRGLLEAADETGFETAGGGTEPVSTYPRS